MFSIKNKLKRDREKKKEKHPKTLSLIYFPRQTKRRTTQPQFTVLYKSFQ